MSGATKNNNRFLKALIDALKEKNPSAFKLCPYVGKYELLNLSINKKIIAIYPSGTFRIDISVTDDVSKAVVSASLQLEIIN